MSALGRSALRDITNTNSSLNASTLAGGGGGNGPLKSILINKSGSRDSIKSSLSNTSTLLSNTSLLGGNSSGSGGGSNNNNNANITMITSLVDFFSNENLGLDITMKTFRDGDSGKLRFFLNHLFKQIDPNLTVTVPTPSENRDRLKQSNNSNSNNNNTTTNGNTNTSTIHHSAASGGGSKHSSISGLDEELVMEIIDHLKIPVQLNKRHFSITPQSRHWQTMIQVMYHLVCIIKHSRNLNHLEFESQQQQLIFFTFLSNLYSPFLENDQNGTSKIINEWKSKFESDSENCKKNVEELTRILQTIQQQLNYFNTRRDPFIELEEKRILLENDFQRLSNSINSNENTISLQLNDLQLKKTELLSLQNQSEIKKRESEIYQKQIEQQTITPFEVQNINREKSNLEEEDSRLNRQLNYTREQLEIIKNQLVQLNENSTLLINQYNNTVLRIDQNLLLNFNANLNSSSGGSLNGAGSGMINGSINRWRINDAKQKKSILKSQLNSLHSQIQQLQELSIERDHANHDLEQALQDHQELLHSLTEAYSKLDDIYSNMKQHHHEELLQIEKRIRSTEEQSVRIHNEKVEWKQQLDQNEIYIAQLEETIAKEEAFFIQKRNACMNVRLDATHILADHKQVFDSSLNNCEKSQMDTFEYIKEIAQYTTSEMQKCINKNYSN